MHITAFFFLLKEWSKIRDDLECDDLKDLPTPTPIQCAIPNAIFGDFMMVLEFFLCFGEELQLKDAFPGGLTFELLERAVIENEVSGPLSDILQILLRSLFDFQDAEAEEVKEAHTTSGVPDAEVAEGGLTYQVFYYNNLVTLIRQIRNILFITGHAFKEIVDGFTYRFGNTATSFGFFGCWK